jgi:glycine cleavage system H lipoate-binding protein
VNGLRAVREEDAVMPSQADRALTELPCVWVTAGVLSYRLCDREYDCEHCALYHALQGGGVDAVAAAGAGAATPGPSAAEDPVGRYLAELGTGCTLHLDRAYSAEGLWMESEQNGDVRIGLDDYTLRLLQPVDDVVLPRVGVWMQHRAPCAWVNRGRLAIALRSPVAGEVVAVHPKPALAPPRGDDRAADRWWFRLRPHESVTAASGLYRNEALLSWFLGRVRSVHDHLNAVMRSSADPSVGPVLNDGGLPAGDLEVVLGRERFEALVGTLFPMQV